MKIRVAIMTTLAAAVMSVSTVRADDPARARKLQQAIDLIESKGDLAHAVPLLEDAAMSTDKTLAVQALLYLGKAQERTDKAAARKTYQQIVSRFGDQQGATTQARARLALLGEGAATAPTDRKVLSKTDIVFPSLTRTGDAIVFAEDLTTPSVIDIRTGGVTRLVDPEPNTAQVAFPLLSPDQKQIVMTWLGPKFQPELQIIGRAPGEKPRTLLSSNAEIRYFRPLAWGPDSTWLVVELQKKDQTWSVARMNAADGRLQVLKSLDWRRSDGGGQWRTSLSPDGRYLAYAALATNPSSPNVATETLDKHVYVLAIDGSSEVDLTATGGIHENPVWTADGSHVLFLSNGSGAFDLWAVAMANGKPISAPVVVQRNIGRVVPIGTTSGGALYYITRLAPVSMLALVDVAPNDHSPSRSDKLPADLVGLRPSWSPDGKYIAYLRPKPGGGNKEELVIRTLATGDERRYFPENGVQIGASDKPLWFPDGHALVQRVTIAGAAPGGDQALYEADPQTGTFAELKGFGRFGLGGEFRAAIGSDNRTLYTTGPLLRPDSNKGGPIDRVMAADLMTGEQRTIFTSGPDTLLPGIALSPDNKTIGVFSFKRPVDFGPNSSVVFHLALIGTDVNGLRELSGPSRWSGAVWSRDGRSLLVVAGPNGDLPPGSIVQADAETGTVRPTGIHVEGLTSFDLSPDGSRMVVGKQVTGFSTEVHVLENIPAALKPHK
jgi:Tol biopolymer transport system component